MTSLPDAITDVLPPDNMVRMGVVTATNPLTVSMQGGLVKSPGRLGSYGPMVGDNVVLLRQDASWLVAGDVFSNTSTVPGAGITTMTQAIASASIPVVAATTLVTGTTITFTTSRPNARYWTSYVFDTQQVGATQTTTIGELFLDASAAVGAPQIIFVGTTATPTGLRVTIGNQFAGVVAAAGTHTLDLRVHRVGGADGNVTINATHSSLMVTVYE